MIRAGRLEKITYFYLLLPWIIFIWGWTRVPIAFLSTLVLAHLTARFWIWANSIQSGPSAVPLKTVAWAASLAIFWTVLGSRVGFANPNSPWLSDLGLLADLTTRAWPLAYFGPRESGILPFVGDLGFLLPAGFLGDLLGWRAAYFFHLLWTAGGITLAFIWILRVLRKNTAGSLIVFGLLGGLDWIGGLFYRLPFLNGLQDWETWSGLWVYLSNASLLTSAPGISIAGWIGVSFWISAREKTNALFPTAAIAMLIFLWSRFVFFGLLPFFVMDCFKAKEELKKLSLFDWIPVFLLFCLGGLFFCSNAALFQFHWLARDYSLFELWPRLLLFLFLEFGFVAVLFGWIQNKGPFRNNPALWLAFVILAVLPIVMGRDSRLYSAVLSVPALAMVWFFALQSFQRPVFLRHRTAALFVFFIGAFPAFSVLARAASELKNPVLSLSGLKTELSKTAWPRPTMLGNPQSFFYRYVARDMIVDDMVKYEPTRLSEDALIQIEAEHFVNTPRVNFKQECLWASGGMIVDNGFGSLNGDDLVYTFDLNRSSGPYQLTLYAATELDGASLRVFINDEDFGTLECPNTQEWWAFKPVSLFLGTLEPRSHTLKLVSNGININIDKLWFTQKVSHRLVLEAESHINPTRYDHVQAIPWASGGRIIDNGFGSEKTDALEFHFNWPRASRAALQVSYATLRLDSSCEVWLDGVELGYLNFTKTNGWGHFDWANTRLGHVGAGPHKMVLKSNGVNVNLDSLVIEGDLASE